MDPGRHTVHHRGSLASGPSHIRVRSFGLKAIPVCSRTRPRRAGPEDQPAEVGAARGELSGKWKCVASRCPQRCGEVVDGLRQRRRLFFGGPVSAVAEHRGAHVNGTGLA